MRAKEFDKKFAEGEDISQYLEVSKARRPQQEQKRVNVDFPLWMIHQLDKEAKRLGCLGSPSSRFGWQNGSRRHPDSNYSSGRGNTARLT